MKRPAPGSSKARAAGIPANALEGRCAGVYLATLTLEDILPSDAAYHALSAIDLERQQPTSRERRGRAA